jgi:hypothetical protein
MCDSHLSYRQKNDGLPFPLRITHYCGIYCTITMQKRGYKPPL